MVADPGAPPKPCPQKLRNPNDPAGCLESPTSTKNCASPTRNKNVNATSSTIFFSKGESQTQTPTKRNAHKPNKKLSLPPLKQRQKTAKAKQKITQPQKSQKNNKRANSTRYLYFPVATAQTRND
jgi:hypothetical protein